MSLSRLRKVCGLALAAAALSTAATIISVPSTADIWLAGMPDGSTASINDSAPGQSPVLVTGLPIVPGGILTFAVSGAVSNTPVCCSDPADGGALITHATGAENGISNATAPLNALMGIFLDASQPDGTPAPAGLDFSVAGALNFSSLAPGLKQVFFIGDGLTSGAVVQQFIVPAGATRLYLGPMDGYEWNNNTGEFRVVVSAIPEPATSLLLGSALAGLALLRRRAR